MNTKVITRFAPSPTGFLHIGGARTALFNWLYAKAHNGEMHLRIEDTDRARSTQAAIDAIQDGLKWLGLDWDGEIVFQHSRAERHQEIAQRLIEQDLAYRCYASPEELTEMRETAKAEGRAPGYDGRWRERSPADAPEGVAPVIRFKAPRDGTTLIQDKVQGDVSFANSDLDDLVLLRSDGSPTYMLSVVVDDHDMGVTTIIRGDDHLTNAARQAQIYQALGWDIPVFAHVPLIHGPDGAKLSKRHGALGVEAYRDMGYLPEAMRNYLVRLGWSHGDDEIFSTEQLIKWFNLEAIGRAPARFDYDKLEHINGHYIQNSTDEALIEAIKPLLPKHESAAQYAAHMSEEKWQRLHQAMPILKERAKSLNNLIADAQFLIATRPLTPNDKARKFLDENGKNVLKNLSIPLKDLANWTNSDIEEAIRVFAAQHDLKLGKIGPAVRAALTGSTSSPAIFDVLYLLGKEESLSRIEDCVG